MDKAKSFIKKTAELYYQWKSLMDKSGHNVHPTSMSKEELDLYEEFITRILSCMEYEDELCGDDEYLKAPFDFIRGAQYLHLYPFNKD